MERTINKKRGFPVGESFLTTAMPSAAAALAVENSFAGRRITGAVAIAIFMVITAIVITVMGVPAGFRTSFHRADRIAVSGFG